ncbi:hypothetical protein [Rickettsia endosymbiont of Cantharis rufa]|uniref:hypothetical protein n=1 Tax=Rickettsia endosymbiont of Cantharis rufa TaxID=3066248 RepID=UPI003132B659
MKLLQEKLLKNLVSFLNKFFLNEGGLDNFFKIACATKFYKKVNRGLLAYYLQEQNINPESIIITMNNFTKLFPFAIAGVCKKIQPDSKTFFTFIIITK